LLSTRSAFSWPGRILGNRRFGPIAATSTDKAYVHAALQADGVVGMSVIELKLRLHELNANPASGRND